MVMAVCGPRFEKLRSLQEETGARLDLVKNTTTLKLSGAAEAVANARKTVESWMEYCRGEVVMIEAGKVGAIYGKNGATIRRIQERTGANIQVNDKEKGKKDKEPVEVSIVGEPEAVSSAKALVLKAVAGEIELEPGQVCEKIELGVGAGAVIGNRGSKIRELELKFLVKLVIQGGTGLCRIVGKPEDVKKAKVEIEGIIAPVIEEKRIAEEAERLTREASKKDGDAGAWGEPQVDDDAAGW